ncbi:phosphotransferase enzyme family protein [Evansella tamaricis]|uniref:Phosphotransferase n=1 Tax=Evansella tamaricis TaxID=2069301 RepID=A0ABS6JCW1_9BACI|nr:phosphotransferase [Evansella tamaricis]MBU9711508.1 phosphotransferase [Evansella tamaricis]
MKKEAAKYFTNDVLHMGADAFNMEISSLKELAGFENYIYGGFINSGEYVLRFCHSSHRNIKQIQGEMDWLSFLKTNGAHVCGPILSNNRSFVEKIIAGDTCFYVSAFEKAQGTQINISENRTNHELFFQWGKATGQLHSLTKKYTPSPGIPPREDYMVMSSEVFTNYLPDDTIVQEKVAILFEEINSLPKTEDTYLLTHTDLHSGNFFYDGERLWIFDFDDCAYHYIIHDLAMPLYYCLWQFNGSPSELQVFGEAFFASYLKGYLTESEMPLEVLHKLPLFLKLRDCDLFAILHHEWGGKELTEKQKSLLSSIRQRIVEEQPVIQLSYEKLLAEVKKLKLE